MVFDPLNLLLLGIALVVFWRLKSVLGRRTGNERPPFDPFGGRPRPGETPVPEASNSNTAPLPPTAEPGGAASEPRAPVWTGFAEADSDLARALEKIAVSDPAFSPSRFLDGARIAYEMIVDSFARGDKAALKNLLGPDVLDGFARAIDARKAAGQTIEQQFVGIGQVKLLSAELSGNRARLGVKFDSQLISATRDKSGEVIEGDPKQIRTTTDIWTFERDVTARDPNWLLTATRELA